jgi:hypothetical protein
LSECSIHVSISLRPNLRIRRFNVGGERVPALPNHEPGRLDPCLDTPKMRRCAIRNRPYLEANAVGPGKIYRVVDRTGSHALAEHKARLGPCIGSRAGQFVCMHNGGVIPRHRLRVVVEIILRVPDIHTTAGHVDGTICRVLECNSRSSCALVTVVIIPVHIALDGVGADNPKSITLCLVGKVPNIKLLTPGLMEPAKLVHDTHTSGRASTNGKEK